MDFTVKFDDILNSDYPTLLKRFSDVSNIKAVLDDDNCTITLSYENYVVKERFTLPQVESIDSMVASMQEFIDALYRGVLEIMRRKKKDNDSVINCELRKHTNALNDAVEKLHKMK